MSWSILLHPLEHYMRCKSTVLYTYITAAPRLELTMLVFCTFILQLLRLELRTHVFCTFILQLLRLEPTISAFCNYTTLVWDHFDYWLFIKWIIIFKYPLIVIYCDGCLPCMRVRHICSEVALRAFKRMVRFWSLLGSRTCLLGDGLLLLDSSLGLCRL